MKNNPKVTGKELAAIIGITEDGIKYQLTKLKKLGVIRHEGPTKAGEWIVLK